MNHIISMFSKNPTSTRLQIFLNSLDPHCRALFISNMVFNLRSLPKIPCWCITALVRKVIIPFLVSTSLAILSLSRLWAYILYDRRYSPSSSIRRFIIHASKLRQLIRHCSYHAPGPGLLQACQIRLVSAMEYLTVDI